MLDAISRATPSCSPAMRAASCRGEKHSYLAALPMQQRIRDRAAAEHPAATVDTWLHAGERLTEEQAAAIAFDAAPLDELLKGTSCATAE